jgi:hypothetical protein
MTKYKIFLFFALIALLSACKSSKNLVVTDGSAVAKAQEQLLNDMFDAQVDYKTISGKISLEMIPGNRTSGTKVNSQLKIVRDDIIQLSLRAPFLNIEAFRINITPDSVYVVDRLNKKIAVENIAKLEREKGISFNYSNLQALFTNALFYPGKKKLTAKDADKYNIKLHSGKYYLATIDRSGINYLFTVDANDRITDTGISAENESYSLNWNYDEFIQDGKYVYPTKMTAKVGVQKKRVTLVMNYSSLDIDKDVKVDKSLPASYARVSVGEILKNYFK